MAGSFGYEAEHYDVSMKMAERESAAEDARRCAPRRCSSPTAPAAATRSRMGRPRAALHVARVLAQALSPAPASSVELRFDELRSW